MKTIPNEKTIESLPCGRPGGLWHYYAKKNTPVMIALIDGVIRISEYKNGKWTRYQSPDEVNGIALNTVKIMCKHNRKRISSIAKINYLSLGMNKLLLGNISNTQHISVPVCISKSKLRNIVDKINSNTKHHPKK